MVEQIKAREGKIIHFGLPEALHKKIKRQALEEDTTLQRLIIKAIEEYLQRLNQEEYDNEPLTEEEMQHMDEAEEDIKAGRVKPWTQIKSERALKK